MQLLKLIALPAMASLALAAGSVSAQPVRIGLIGPFSGGSGDFGNSARLGAELAVKEINEVGGYMSRKFELVIRDDKATPDVGLKGAQELVLEEKVNFTIGFCNTGVAMKALDVFQTNKHLLMVPCSQGTALTTKYPPQQSYIFRVAPPDLTNAKFLIAEIADRRKLTRVAIFADQTGYGEGGLKDLTAELAARGLAPVYVARFALGVTTLTEQMRATDELGNQHAARSTVLTTSSATTEGRTEFRPGLSARAASLTFWLQAVHPIEMSGLPGASLITSPLRLTLPL